MKVLVTGGAGFLGSTLVDRLLADGCEVDVIDDLSTGSLRNLAEARSHRSGTLKIHQCDVRDDGLTALIDRRNPDVVYHLATSTARGAGRPPVGGTASVDLLGTVLVLDAVVAAGAGKVVFAGRARSGSVTGLAGVAERAPVDLVMAAREATGIEATVLEFGTVYGPRQRPGTASSVVATFVDRLRQGLPCVVHGSGDQTRDFLFVEDAADALVRALDRGDGLTVGVGTGRQTSIVGLYQALAAIAGVTDDGPVPGARRAGDTDAVEIDPARARIYLGWEPFTPLAEGLAETLLADR